MQLTMKLAEQLYTAMTAIEQHETTELDALVRLRLAINTNLLRPFVEAFQRSKNKLTAELATIERATAGHVAALEERAAQMADELIDAEVKLKKFVVDDFKLDTNKRITGMMLALLEPVIKDFHKVLGDEE